ncbi:MAG: hypothetical protein M0Q38_04935 [Bacteroidales bacterium]|jgi:hypothetical protein|nr:hypothetical protein [Bacteroidales bacterium]
MDIPSESSNIPRGSLSILEAENDSINLRLIKATLTDAGYKEHCMASGMDDYLINPSDKVK